MYSSSVAFQVVMISSGDQGDGGPLVKIFVHFGGSAPTFLYHSSLSKRIDLASDVFYGIAIMNFLTTLWLFRSL